MALTPAPRRVTDWTGLYCYAYWRPAHTDAFITGTLAPLMEALRGGGQIQEWFFVRYRENGPHLRIRVQGAGPATVRELRARLTEAVRSAPYPADGRVEQAHRRAAGDPRTLRGHGEVCEAVYEPETGRYGGSAAALAIAEEVFCRSSRIAAAVVGRTTGPARRLSAAMDFVLVTALSLGLGPLDTVRWLRRGVIGWRSLSDGAGAAPMTVGGSALDAAAAQSGAVVRRWRELQEPPASGTRLRDQWAACVTAARARLEADETVDRAAWLQVWLSQLHMLLNRLGVLPEEERSLCWFVASSLLAPEGATDYFADHPAAVDRRYLDASNFVPGRMEWQQPRRAPQDAKRPRRTPGAGPPVALPAGDPPRMPLGGAMARRASGHGDLGGPVTAQELGALLWPAYAGHAAPGADGRAPRPYPSAGGQYVARLRLVVRDVAGLAPGLYELQPETRTLLPVAAAPTTGELASASMWFAAQHTSVPRGVDVSTLPALIGLYVELGALRARYGLRAMRFAYLEAGHLAQNLALTAAATGLSLGMVGAFYDDVAHELFMLDGIDDVLAYLLPAGRAAAG